jgi:hypothetical protein
MHCSPFFDLSRTAVSIPMNLFFLHSEVDKGAYGSEISRWSGGFAPKNIF